jgi:hypothetical protein
MRSSGSFGLGYKNILSKLALDDIFGRILQDAGILTRKRAPKEIKD